MKKRLAIGLAGVMVISALTGCGKGKSQYLLDVDYTEYVDLCEYKGVEADKIVYDVTDDEIDDEIEMEMYDYITYDEITDRGIEEGDYVVLDYTGKLDGEESEDYSGEEEEIVVGEGYFYPEVEEALLGMKTGESVNVDVELTEDYAEEGDEGKQLALEVTVGTITVENIPECDEDFVKENTEYDSLEDYRASVKETLMESKEDEYKSVAVEEIMDYLLANSTFNGYPQELYDECEEYYDYENESYASMYGMETDEFLEMMGIDDDTRTQEIEDNVNYELVIGAIAQLEGIDCSEKEVKKYVEENYEDFGYESEDEFYEDYSDSDVGYQLVYEKVVDFLYENAQYVELDEDEYLEQQEAEWYTDEDEETEDESEEELDEDEDETDEESEETEDETVESSDEEDTEETSEDDSQEETTETSEE